MIFKIKCSNCGKEFEANNYSLNIFCSVGCQVERDPIEPPQQEHPTDCPWHQDWHACTCGLFDATRSPP